MKFFNILLSALALYCVAGCAAVTTQTIELPANAVVLDVRSEKEFKGEHLPGAINLPLPEISRKAPVMLPDKNTPLYLYCGSGRRAGKALKTLQKSGYTNLHNLGGIREARRKLKTKVQVKP